MAITISEEPAFVNRPKSVIAKGQIAGHINEQPNAMSAMNQMEKAAGAAITATEPTTPKRETITRAFA